MTGTASICSVASVMGVTQAQPSTAHARPSWAPLATVPLPIIDDLGMRKLPHTAAEDLLEIIMRRYELASTMLSSNRPMDDWGKLLGDTAAVTALLDRLLPERNAGCRPSIPGRRVTWSEQAHRSDARRA
jgi:hypothetical protein